MTKLAKNNINSKVPFKGLFGKNNLRARLFPDYLLGIS
jgi:hypothetical protein